MPTKPAKSKRRSDILKDAAWVTIQCAENGMTVTREVLMKKQVFVDSLGNVTRR
jgi:hypothetical protein